MGTDSAGPSAPPPSGRQRGRLLAAGLVWGLAGAFASSASPSPSSHKVVLRLGWIAEPDNLNPFVG